jgi:hypothetical protein
MNRQFENSITVFTSKARNKGSDHRPRRKEHPGNRSSKKGCRTDVDDTPEAIILSSFDPLAAKLRD